MRKTILLDCTLRDGGYINDWHFGRDVISSVCVKLATAKIDIIEVGFLTNLPHTEDDSLYSNCAELDAVTAECQGPSQIAAMIAIGEMELDPEMLVPASQTRLDIVRITFHNNDTELKKAFLFARHLMDKGYQVCMQPVGTTSYTDKELLDLITEINVLEPYAFYLVDTLGILQHKELQHFIDLIDHNLNSGIKLGFHSHNNLQMSYSNAQYIINYNTAREFILDCSVYGMGRGAGNLCTELIAQYENSAGLGQYGLTPLYEILDNEIYPIFIHLGWGYNSHYYISAVHQCHPNYASFLMNKQTLTMNEVDLILKNIPKESRAVFHKKLIEDLYYNFQNRVIDDSTGKSMLKNKIKNRDVLLLASGKSLNSFQREIYQFIEDRRPVVISVNSLFPGFPSDYVFVSNLKRLYMLDTETLPVPTILTSNLPNIVRGGIYVDYASLCGTGEEPDNSGMMLLRLMKNLGMEQVHIAGYDGFSREPKDNYFDEKLINSVDPGALEKKTVAIAKQIEEIMAGMEVISLTPSRYLGVLI